MWNDRPRRSLKTSLMNTGNGASLKLTPMGGPSRSPMRRTRKSTVVGTGGSAGVGETVRDLPGSADVSPSSAAATPSASGLGKRIGSGNGAMVGAEQAETTRAAAPRTMARAGLGFRSAAQAGTSGTAWRLGGLPARLRDCVMTRRRHISILHDRRTDVATPRWLIVSKPLESSASVAADGFARILRLGRLLASAGGGCSRTLAGRCGPPGPQGVLC